MIEAQTRFRVRYQETDAQGIAHHSNYVVWMELGRVDFLTQAGFPYREVERRGVHLIVTNLGVKYRKAAFFDDEITITTRLGLLKSRLVRFEYRLERVEDGAFLAEAFSEHMATDLEKRVIGIPEFLRDLLEP